jgi:hypothetical protein
MGSFERLTVHTIAAASRADFAVDACVCTSRAQRGFRSTDT